MSSSFYSAGKYQLLKTIQTANPKLFGMRMFGTYVNANNSNFNNVGEKEKSLEEEVLEISRRRA